MNKREWMLQFVLGNPFYDMEDTVGTAAALYDAIVAASPEPADEGWIEHRGKRPYPEGNVAVQLRNGHTFDGDADMFVWSHGDGVDEDSEIVKWRPAT